MSKLSVIIPVFNEGPQLASFIEMVMAAHCPIEREWIFIDDCSRDNSLQILKKYSQTHQFKVFEQTPNQGKGAAVMRGIQEATGEILIIQDADFEYDPNDVPKLIEPIIGGKADVVFGSRFKQSPQVHRTYHYFVNRFLTILSNLLSGIYLTDMETCYKVFRTDLVRPMCLKSKRFGIEIELTAYVAKLRASIFEIPVSYFPRTKLQGKKINWKDGIAALYHLFRFNWFTPIEKAFNPIPAHYLLSHFQKHYHQEGHFKTAKSD